MFTDHDLETEKFFHTWLLHEKIDKEELILPLKLPCYKEDKISDDDTDSEESSTNDSIKHFLSRDFIEIYKQKNFLQN